MKHLKRFGSIIMLLILISMEAFATSNIDSTDKYAWSETAGWMNFNDSNGGVTVYSDHLEGYVWAENVGLIRLGTHTSGGTHTYANTSDTDYGVNNDGSGNLSGYAWSENIGWINFNPNDSQVTINATTGDFDGYAWAENVGSIHFNNTEPAYKVRQLSPEMDVQGKNTSIADGDTTVSTNDDTDFGDVTVASNTTKTFTIKNTAGVELNLTGSPIVSVTGNGFSVTTQPISPVAVTTGETTFVVKFEPSTAGIVTGEISIANDDSDENPYNFNITANALNDTPVISDIADQTTNEDTATAAIDFTISDVATAVGDLTLTGSSSNTALVSDANIVFGGSDGNRTVTVTPLANQSGSATITVTVSDGSLTATDTFELTVNAVSDAPTTADKIVTVNEDEAYTFTEADFEFSDIETGNSLNKIKITQLPTVGTLQLDGADVTIDQEIAVADIPKLTFTPAANANGSGYATFKFKVHDGTSYSDAEFTMTVDVTAVNDLPSFTKGDDQTVFVNAEQNIPAWATNIYAGPDESQSLTFIVTNDNNSLFSVQPAIDALGNLTFTPSAVGNAVVTVILSDGIDTSAAQTFNIKVNPLPLPATQQTTPEPTGCSVGANINCTVKNEGTITDVKIEPEGSIEGGILEGEINNEGILTDVTLAEGTKIEGGTVEGTISGNPEAPAILINVKITAKTELIHVILEKNVELPNDVTLKNVQLRGSSVNGGKLEGTIRTTSSATVIKNVSLGENATIIGGKLAGTISGTPKNPAVLQHLQVEPQTQLTDVTIADGVEMPTDVSLASGVRFTKTENIPTDVDLTETLPKKGESVDLSADPVIGGEGILPAINRLQEFAPAELTVLQHDKGFIYLDIEGIRYAVNPIKVKHLSESERLQLESGQTVRFKTDTQIDVLAPPAVQDISSLKQTLIKINLPEVNISNDGNIKIPATETIWYSARPDLASTIVDKNTANGFITKEDGNVALIFEDEKGEKREQILYPSPADMSALGKFDLTPNGILEFEINGQKFKGRLDYKVEQGTTTAEGIKVTAIPDSNGDFMITYPDGAEQRLFGLPE